tara:strand:+ start:2653 stop:3153 length:501 start_codon:yes stop_codon:yes gene_type:complete
MKKSLFTIFILLVLATPSFADDTVILAKEIGPELIRKDFEYSFSSTFKGQGSYTPIVSYIAKYHVIFIKVENHSESILNLNPNYFTLVSDKKVSYSYSPETHAFKEKLGFLTENSIQAVDVYPNTMSEGFLLFDKKHEDERPQKLYFKNLNKHIPTDVVLDKNVKK